MKTWTRHELLAVAYPYCLLVSICLILTVFCFQQNMTVLIYSSLPDTSKSPIWFAILMLQEANMYMYSMFSVALIFQLHILFPLKLTRVMSSLAHSAHQNCRTMLQLSDAVGHIRCIQLLVSLFNIGHRNCIQGIKLLCILTSTVTGYVAVGHGRENPMIGIMACCVTCDAIFLYGFVYEKAFGIPDGLEKVKKVLKMRLIRKYGRQGPMARALERQIDSVPTIALQVGDFHTMERVSTLVFMDYVVRNIVNLLVMI